MTQRELIIGGTIIGAILGALLAGLYLCGCQTFGEKETEWEYVQPVTR